MDHKRNLSTELAQNLSNKHINDTSIESALKYQITTKKASEIVTEAFFV